MASVAGVARGARRQFGGGHRPPLAGAAATGPRVGGAAPAVGAAVATLGKGILHLPWPVSLGVTLVCLSTLHLR